MYYNIEKNICNVIFFQKYGVSFQMYKNKNNHEQIEKLRDLFINTLEFKLYSCGVSKKVLPYNEHWTLRPDGYISQVTGAHTNILFKDRLALHIKSGGAVILPPNLQHRAETPCCNQDEAVFRWAHFQFFVAYSFDIFNFFELPFVISGKEGELFGDFNEKFTYFNENKEFSALAVATGIKKTAFELLDAMLRIVPMKIIDTDIGDKIYKIQSVLKYIDKNLTHNITIAELARLANMSQTRFHVAFKNIMSLSPYEYLIRQRLKKAQRMLWMTKLPISDISAKCGYEDQFFFSKLFKKHIGVTPSLYRQQEQNNT
jgi:AraC-like DNA-binding protein